MPVGLKSTEQVLADAFATLGCERWGGASVEGWSKVSDYLRCPYRYYLKHVRRVWPTIVGTASSSSRDVGSFVHAALAAHYAARLPAPFTGDDGSVYCYPGWREVIPTPEQLFEALHNAGAEVGALYEAEHVWSGYIERWGLDDWQPLAVEMAVGNPKLHTSRYDLVVSVEDGIHDGIWIGEHKTASPSADLEQWMIDGEILGEMLSWRLSKLDQTFGESLRGVCINVLLKKKIIDNSCYRRIWIPVDWNLVDDFDKHRTHYREMEQFHYRTGYWPKSHYGCYAKNFDKCVYWDHCCTLSESCLAPIEG